MGWTGTHATHYKNGKVDRKAECEALLNDERNEVLKMRMVGSTAYMAVRTKATGEVWAAVFLTSVDNSDYFNFNYKDMDETMHPYYYRCSDSILDLLTPTEDRDANEWRAKCREYNQKAKSPDALKNLPVGSVIHFGMGEYELTLVKTAPMAQFERPFWKVCGEYKYFPRNHIPNDYEVIERGSED